MQAYFDANKQAWDKRTAVHRHSAFYNAEGFINGQTVLTPIELAEIGPVAGKSLLHLQCHFGLDTLNWARLGATVTGVDFSEVAIQHATDINQQLGYNASFVCSNVYDTLQYLTQPYDIVFTSYGTIGWLPYLDKWAKVVAGSLKTGGTFYMADFHPMVWMFDDAFTHLQYSYYNQEVIVTQNTGSYSDRTANIATTEYGWNHSLADLLNALLQNGLQLQFFNEHAYSPYPCFSNTVQVAHNQWQIKGLEGKIPMVYSLKAIKM